MRFIIFLTLLAVCVVAADIEQINHDKSAPIKTFTIPHITKLNSLDVTPIYSTPFVNRGRQIKSRIVGGTDVKEDQQYLFAFQVRLVTESKNETRELSACAGTVIRNEWVLTAAHCLDQSRRVIMYFGMLDHRDSEYKVQRNATAANWFIHPDWSRKTFQNDIALIRLVPKLNLTDEIRAIRLPSRAKNCTQYFGTRVTVSGWGLTSDSFNDDSTLKYVDVNVVKTKEECSKTWGSFVDFNKMICVDASRKRGACTGDSGGPMVYTQRNGLQLLIGVTSFGTTKGCETEDHRVYTCINGYRDWIFNVTKDKYLED